MILLPARRDIATGDAWRQHVGAETAGAWQQLLQREVTTATGWERGLACFALCWLEEGFDEVLGGSPAAMALAGTQAKASGLADCLEASDGSEEAWRGCIGQIDPETVVP